MRSPTPPVVLTYGLLGVIPFIAPAAAILALYAGLILSFLGGARWAFANRATPPRALTISLSMLPTLAALALLAMPEDARRPQLLGLAAALALHWLWDLRAPGLPGWYPTLRTLLTAGAVAGLLAGAITLT